jgi:hypothetical protein
MSNDIQRDPVFDLAGMLREPDARKYHFQSDYDQIYGRPPPRAPFVIGAPWYVHFHNLENGERGAFPCSDHSDQINCPDSAADLARWLMRGQRKYILWCTQSALVTP